MAWILSIEAFQISQYIETLRKSIELRVTIVCSFIIFLIASPFICFSYERTVKLQDGETVVEICKKDEFYGTWNEEIKKEIIKANPGININKIKAGVKIIIPYLPKYESPNLASMREDIKTKRDEIWAFADSITKLVLYTIAVIALVLALGSLLGILSLRRVRIFIKELRDQFPSFTEAQKQLEVVTDELIEEYGYIKPFGQDKISEKEKIRIIDIEHQIYSLSPFSAGKQFKKKTV